MVNYRELTLDAVQEADQLLLRGRSEHQLPSLLAMASRMPWAMGERERVGDAVDSGDGGGVGAGDAVAMAYYSVKDSARCLCSN
jgi:hypothetical protein